MKTKNDIEIVKGSREFVGLAQRIYQLIESESKRGNMLSRDFQDIQNEIDDNRCFIALYEQEPIGYVCVYPWSNLGLVEIASLVVGFDYRKQGIGTRLVNQAQRLAIKVFPEWKIVSLANDHSSHIFRKSGLISIPKCCLPPELWEPCSRCKNWGKLPSCHCTGLIQSETRGRFHIEPLLIENASLTENVAKIYCQIWKEPPWNEDFWNVKDVVSGLKQELRVSESYGFVVSNHDEIVSFTWGYRVNVAKLAQIAGHNQLDYLFNGKLRKVFYIDELGTAKEYRGNKIGKELSWQLLSVMEKQGFDLVLLRTDVQAIVARNLYQKLGFQELPIFDKKHQHRTYWTLTLSPRKNELE